MIIELKSDTKQLVHNKDRCSLWVSKNDKSFICSITFQERDDGTVLITLIPNDATIKTTILKPDPTAKDYEYMAVPPKTGD